MLIQEGCYVQLFHLKTHWGDQFVVILREHERLFATGECNLVYDVTSGRNVDLSYSYVGNDPRQNPSANSRKLLWHFACSSSWMSS